MNSKQVLVLQSALGLGLQVMRFATCLSWLGNLRPGQTSSKLSPCTVAVGVKSGDEYENTLLERDS